jgi:hypothetical protein
MRSAGIDRVRLIGQWCGGCGFRARRDGSFRRNELRFRSFVLLTKEARDARQILIARRLRDV